MAFEDGQAVGWSSFSQSQVDYQPQKININSEVLQEYRHRGIGAVLHDRVLDGLKRFAPRILRADVL